MTAVIRFARWPQSALLYRVLAHMDLGPDAATLFDPELPSRAWTRALTGAYRSAPGRLLVQGLGLREHRDLAATLVLHRPAMLDDAPGQVLASQLVQALRDEGERYDPPYGSPSHDLVETLERLRSALWERSSAAPPLRIIDCPALGLAGRGGADAWGRVVAVSLRAPPAHILCQVLHEEVHAVTDPVVRQGWRHEGRAQDTRVGSDGFALHRELEIAAVEVGAALIQARAPQWSDAYTRWRSLYSQT